MIQISAIKFIIYFFLILYHNQIYGQDIKKETLYILFEKNDGSFDNSLGKKFVNKKGVNFNLYKYYYTNYKNLKTDTLCINKLNKYHLTDENDIENKANQWRKRNKEKLKKKFGVLYRQATEYKNNIFNTYIIEKINSKQIVLYKVKFRNEGVMK